MFDLKNGNIKCMFDLKNNIKALGIVVHTFNPRIQEVEEESVRSLCLKVAWPT